MALLLLSALARGEEILPLGQNVRAIVDMVPSGCRYGGYGFASVLLQNLDASPHEIGLDLASSYGAPPFLVTKKVPLAAGEQVTLFLPLYLGDGARNLRFAVDGNSIGGRGAYCDTSPRGGMSVLNVTEDPTSFRNWYEELRLVVPPSGGSRSPATGLYYGSSGSEVVGPRAPSQLPDRWQLLSGYDLVLIDGRAKGLDAERQRHLVGHLAAGGTTFLLFPDALPPGPLRALAAGSPRVRSGLHAFGRWASFDGSTRLESLPEPERLRLQWALRTRGGLAAPAEPVSGYAPPSMLHALQIPGLGEVPVRGFFLSLTLFALLVGPVNYIVLKRRRRLMWLLVTVPLSGLIFTGALLTYGVFREGFGIQGVQRSLTVLDQRSHEAVSCTTRTLFAGLSPSSLAPGAGTYLWCLDFLPGEWRADQPPHRLEIDMDAGGRIDGSILPSRTMTTLVTVTQSAARERARFRRRGDAIEALPAPQFEDEGQVLLRDFDGSWWEGRAGGPLRAASGPGRTRDLILRRFFDFELLERKGLRLPSEGEVRAWADDLLQPGSYLAAARAAAAAEEFGLAIDYREQAHVLVGLLAEEDFVE